MQYDEVDEELEQWIKKFINELGYLGIIIRKCYSFDENINNSLFVDKEAFKYFSEKAGLVLLDEDSKVFITTWQGLTYFYSEEDEKE